MSGQPSTVMGAGPLAGPDGLAARLGGGIAQAAARTLPESWPYTDADLQARGLRQVVAGLYAVRTAAGLTPDIVDTTLGQLAGLLSEQRPLMLAVLFSSARLPALVPQFGGRAGADPVDGWLGTCWIAEAAWTALQSPLTGRDWAAGDRELLLPLAARCRFLALSEPMRWRGHPGSPWLAAPGDEADDPVDRVFGTGSWHILVGRCREARREWAGYLDAYQSHTYLAQATPGELERELRMLVFGHRRTAPLCLSVRPLGADAPLTAEDKTLIGEVTDRHLLPRFDLASVAALAMHDDTRSRRRARAIGAVLAGLAGLAAVACAGVLLIRPAAGIAAGCYLLVGAGVIWFGPRWAAPWLLRLPAASAVGIIALVSILPGGWLSVPPLGAAAVAALTMAALGYLVIEVRNHGTARRAALRRSLSVAAIGAGHALMVSLIGLAWVAPAFIGSGASIAALWRHPGYGHAGMDLALATAWCLAVGVFSQVLWDDRPITAPLAHLTWRAR